MAVTTQQPDEDKENHAMSMMTPTTIFSRKRRVRFEPDALDVRQVKRRIVVLPQPKASLLTKEEKQAVWMQADDHRATLYDVMALMEQVKQQQRHSQTTAETASCPEDDPHRVPFAQYAEALAVTFTLCQVPPCVVEDDDEGERNSNPDDDSSRSDASDSGSISTSSKEEPIWNIRKSSSVAQLALWASHHTCTRGVESKLLPGLMHERQLRRNQQIQAVLEAQQAMRKTTTTASKDSESDKEATSSYDIQSQTLSQIAQQLSYSAKQFATALAMVDGKQAWMEYTSPTETKTTSTATKQANDTPLEAETLVVDGQSLVAQ